MDAKRRLEKITRSIRFQNWVKTSITYLGLGIFMFITALPFYWLLLTSLRRPDQIYRSEGIFQPINLTLENYVQVIFNSNLPNWFLNSVVIAGSTTLLSIIISILAAFSLSHLRFRGSKQFSQFVFFLYLVPTSLLFIPLYVLLAEFSLLDSRWSLLVSYPTFIIPFLTWVLLGYFKTISRELIDAALIDGCSHLQALVQIVLPLAAPAIATSMIFGLSFAWNEMLYALTFIHRDELRTMPVGITSFLQMELMRWGPAMASAAIAALPPVILYMFLQKNVVQGLTGGAVKG